MNLYKDEFSRNCAIVIILFIALLLQQSWVPGFFHDGYLYAAFGKNAAELGHWLVPHASDSAYARFFHHLPFVFMLEGLFFKIFGASYITARIFGAIFTLLSLFTLFRITFKYNKYWAYFSSIAFVLIPPLLKKSRFPNLDLPLMLWITLASLFYIKALSSKKQIHWLLVGLFFGLAALTKGPMAMFIPIAIIIHLIIEKEISVLSTLRPWLGLLLGLLIFAIWPALLYLSGNEDIFHNYIKFTFLNTIRDSRGTGEPFYTYFLFLLKQASIWLFLAGFTIYQIFQRRYKSTELNWFFSLFLAVLIPLSFFKFKYSHYLIPLYPALAALAGFAMYKSSEKFKEYFFPIFNILTIITILVFLIFPVTTKIRRDPEIFKIREVLKLTGTRPKNWGVVDGVYPYWSLHNLNAFEDHSNTYNLNGNWWDKLKGESWGILINQAKYKQNQQKIDLNFRPLLYFRKQNMLFLIEKSLLTKKKLGVKLFL